MDCVAVVRDSDVVDGVGQITVSDNGLGFEMEEVQDKLFGLHQTFHTGKDSKGIGLFLAHRHVTSLGGEIYAESEIIKGTTFTIRFRTKEER